MAGSPKWKVYDANGKYQAACKEIEAAAVLASWYEHGATIRFGHPKKCTVWTEGPDGIATDNYDAVINIVCVRYREIQEAAFRKIYGDPATNRALAEQE